MTHSNPWRQFPHDVYEKHMGHENVQQLEILLENEVQNNFPISFIYNEHGYDTSNWQLTSVKDESGCVYVFDEIKFGDQSGNAMKYYVVDVFTDRTFGGNPAGVCLLDAWLPDAILQNIAMENNLSETAFLVKQNGYYDLRWFTPKIEIDLCGHATMGSAYVLFKFREKSVSVLKFQTQSGILSVKQKGEMLWMDFPSRPALPVSKYDGIGTALGIEHYEVHTSADLLVVLDSEEIVKCVQPNFERLKILRI